MFGLAILVGATGTARAEWKSNSMEVGVYAPYEFFDNKAALDDSFGIGARFGYKFVKGHEVEAGWNDISSKLDAGVFGKFDTDIRTFNLGYLYNWTKSKGLTPFVTGGVGNSRIHVNGGGSESDMSLYGGGGVRFYFSNSLNIRLEGDYQRINVPGTTLSNWIAAVGVGWSFGGK